MGTTEIVESNNDAELFGGSLPELRQLCLQDLDSFTSIVGLNNHLGILKFKMLNHLKVCGCNQLEYLLPLDVLKDLQQLKNIDISDCDKLEQVFKDEQDAQTTNSNVMEVLPLLHSFQLSNLPQLASICSRAVCVTSHSLTQMTVKNCPNFNFTFAYPLRRIEEQEPSQEKSKEMIVTPSRLENLDLHVVDHLKKMYKDLRVRFMRLTSLQLDKCNNLEYLFSLSMAQELSSLRELKIISCDKIEQIVKRETEERASANIVEFPQVKTLHLDKLPKFTGSSSSQDGYSVKWLALATVKVVDCPKIRKSMLGMVDRPLLNNVTVTNCPPLEYEDRESKIGYLFDLTDELSKLKDLKIQDLKELKKYMEMDLQESSFTQLETVEAFQCDNELNKLFSFLLNKSRNLKQLTVGSCELLEQVFDLTDFAVAEEQRNLKFPNLHTMQLLCLPKLNCIWNKDPTRIVELGKLVKLEIIECGLRKSPLSTALLKKLVLLEKLKIESCKMIEQVVEDGVELQERSFPKLNDLQLANLPKLVKFNSGHCNFRFPKLLSLRIEKCPELNAFTAGFLSNQTLTIEGTSDQVPQDEKMHACPELQTLKLEDLKAVEVDSLGRLVNMESLDVRNCSSLKGLVLPSNCLNMKEIKISDCNNLEEICTDPEKGKADKKSFHQLHSIVLEKLPVLSFFSLETSEFPSLKKLKIVNCPKLVTLPRNVSAKAHNLSNKVQHSELVLFRNIREDSPAEEGKMKIPPQLETLELSDLPKMQLWNQEPTIVVFEKLTSLKIIGCGSLKKLFSISVAGHLSSLKWLTLYKCEKMVQVLQGGGGNSKRVFQKLETLVLKHLPTLTSFSGEDVEFGEFPELKMVRVENIPKMETFVKKPLNTPKLKQVLLTHLTKYWLGDLNETIRYLHQHHDTLKDEVWECDGSSTRHHTDTAESSSQASSRLREAAETELHGGMPRMEHEGDEIEIKREL